MFGRNVFLNINKPGFLNVFRKTLFRNFNVTKTFCVYLKKGENKKTFYQQKRTTNNEIKNEPKRNNDKISYSTVPKGNKRNDDYKTPPKGNKGVKESTTDFYDNINFDGGMNDYLEKMAEFTTDFSKLKSKKDLTKSPQTSEEQEVETKISYMFNSTKIRSEGTAYILRTMIELYKYITNTDETHRQSDSYERHMHKIKMVADRKFKREIKEVFSRNEIVDALNIVFRHLNDVKSTDMVKLVNILTKIEYNNFDNWKLIFKQYILYLSLLSTSFQPLQNKDVVLILTHFKDIYNFLPYTVDEETQKLLQRAIQESLEYILKNIEDIQPRYVATTITNLSKLGLFDDEICKKLEKYLTRVVKEDEISDTDFVNILFSIYKSNCAGEQLIKIFERKCELILNYYAKNPDYLDSFVITIMCKAMYYGYRKEKKTMNVYKIMEDLFISHAEKFKIHEIVSIAHSLYYLTTPSEEFIKQYDKILKNLIENQNDFREFDDFMIFQILLVIMKRPEFSHKTVVKYVNLYRDYVMRNRIQQKHVKVFKGLLELKIKKEPDSPELTTLLNQVKNEIDEFSSTSQKISQF